MILFNQDAGEFEYLVSLEVWCDQHHCTSGPEGGSGYAAFKGRNDADVLLAARREGWSVRPVSNVSFCPKCAGIKQKRLV